MRDDHELVGWGMATGVWEALQMPAAVRIVLTANGHAEVATAASDIGTGTYTIMAQVAADMLGLPIDNISVKLGDSSLPQSPLEGGSWIAASVCNAIATTAHAVRKELLRLAKRMKDSPLAWRRGGRRHAGGRQDRQHEGSPARLHRSRALCSTARSSVSSGEESNTFTEDKLHARNAHSAVFAEVKVDEELGVIRVTRVVNAVAAGRILNLKTAHSQIMGSVVWGIGMALHEETLYDHHFGRVMNANIAEYHVPVNADVHDIEVIFVDEPDETINPLGIKGLGEIGIVGVAAAIANAVYHATGKTRPRSADHAGQGDSVRMNRRQMRAQAQNPGVAGSSLPPTRTGATRSASPVASSVSTATPLSVATPAAGSKRPDGMPVVKRRSGSSFCMPMTES